MRKVRREGPHSCIPHFLCHLENNTPVLSVALHSIIVRFTSHAASLWCSPSVQIPPPPPAHHRLIWPLKRSRQKKEKKKPTNKKTLLLFLSLHLLSLCLSFVLSVSLHTPPHLPFPSPPLHLALISESCGHKPSTARFRSGLFTMSYHCFQGYPCLACTAHNGET